MHETLGKAFHPTDLVDQVDVYLIVGPERGVDEVIQCLDVDPVLANTMG